MTGEVGFRFRSHRSNSPLLAVQEPQSKSHWSWLHPEGTLFDPSVCSMFSLPLLTDVSRKEDRIGVEHSNPNWGLSTLFWQDIGHSIGRPPTKHVLWPETVSSLTTLPHSQWGISQQKGGERWLIIPIGCHQTQFNNYILKNVPVGTLKISGTPIRIVTISADSTDFRRKIHSKHKVCIFFNL